MDKSYRFPNLYAAVLWSDGFFDCLKAMGKIDEQSTYMTCYIDMDKDVRVVLIGEQTKEDFPDIPVVLVSKDKLQKGELEQLAEIRMGQKVTN